MASLILGEVLADRERLGITQLLETGGVERPVSGMWIYSGPETAGGPQLPPTLLISPSQVHVDAGHGDSHRLSTLWSWGNFCCTAVSEAREIPRYLWLFSKKTGMTVFASRFDPWLLKSRLLGLFAEKGDRRITLHGVLVQVYGIGVLITGESGTGKTLCGIELVSSGAGWVADDAVVLEARGDALYGREHKRTKGLIAPRGSGICRTERLLGAAALLSAARVEMIVRLQRSLTGGDIQGSAAPRSVQKIMGISLHCWLLAADDEPWRMAGRVREIVRAFIDSGACSEAHADGGMQQ